MVATAVLVAFTQIHLSLDISIDYEARAVSGTAVLRLRNHTGASADQIPLLLHRLMSITEVRDGNGQELPVTSKVVVFNDAPTWQVLSARVRLPAPVAPGEHATIRIAFGGPLVGYPEALPYVKDRVDPSFTILRVDAWAFPSLGEPSITSLVTMRREPFEFDLRANVAVGQVVATAGTERRRLEQGERVIYEYAGTGVPYLNIAIAPYVLQHRGGIRVYALPEDRALAPRLLDSAERALSLLAEWFGPLAAPPALAIIEIPIGFGSQASLRGGIILEAPAFKDVRSLRELYHELTHLWNIPDRENPSIRWNEGLATWLQYRLADKLDGLSTFDQAYERTRVKVCNAVGENEPPARSPFVRYGDEKLTDWSYSVGFLMFAALEKRIGLPALTGALATYIRAFRDSGGSLRDLGSTLDDAVADDLQLFFDDWLYTTRWTATACG